MGNGLGTASVPGVSRGCTWIPLEVGWGRFGEDLQPFFRQKDGFAKAIKQVAFNQDDACVDPG